MSVYYREEPVGQFFADILVNQLVVLELKAIESLHKAHEVPLVNDLAATGMPLGLLINFGPERVEVRRKVRNLKSTSCPS